MKASATLAALALLAPAAAADVVTLPSVRDNSIFSENSAYSNGSGTWIFTGRTAMGHLRRALLHFDVAGSVPAGSTINAVTLRLEVDQTITVAWDVSMHRLTSDWGEAGSDAPGMEGTGGPAALGDATWTDNFFGSSTWTTPGGDFVAAPSATASVGGFAIFSWSGPGLVADAQAWLDGAQPEYGWILKHDDEVTDITAKRYPAREYVGGAINPELVIDFTPPAGSFPAFCPGTAGLCPCGNAGAGGAGCENSFATGGAALAVSGNAQVSNDTVDLAVTGLPPTAPALFFQGTTQVNGGNGTAFGDGLRCVAGAVQRLRSKIASGGAASYPGVGDPLVSVQGMVPGGGGTRYYQVWYRNVAPFCAPEGFNLSNARQIDWLP